MIHKILSVTFYQSVTMQEKCIIGTKAFNTIDGVLLKGVKISRVGESIEITHDEFESSYCVGMANVRHYRFEKEATEQNLSPLGASIEHLESTMTTTETENMVVLPTSAVSSSINYDELVNLAQYENTKKDQGNPESFTKMVGEHINENAKEEDVDILEQREKLLERKNKKKAKKKTKKKVTKKCTPKKKKNS